MLRFKIMSRLGLAEPLVRLARSVEQSNRRSAQKPAEAPLPQLTLGSRSA